MAVETLIDTRALYHPDLTLHEESDGEIIVTRTPMRITLGGGGTDVPWYASKRGGAWISAAFNKYLTVTLNVTEDPSFLGVWYGREATMTHDYNEIPNPFIKACLEETGVTRGINLAITSSVSGRSGLGGSGALEVGVLNALHTYKRETVSPLQLAKEAYEIEGKKLGAPIGPQDQYIVALGGIQYFELDTHGNIYSERLHLKKEFVRELESRLLYFRTGIYRDARSVLGDQKEKAEKNIDEEEKQIRALDEIKDLGQDVKRWLLEGNLDEFGKSLDTHWKIKQRLSNKVSTSQIDDWYEEAIKAGALGGKIMGAGGGGWFVFYVPQNREGFRQRMKELQLEEKHVQFDWKGTTSTRLFN